MSSTRKDQCDCHLYKTFPHRRNKCAFGIGKSKDPVAQEKIVRTPNATEHIENEYRGQPVQAVLVDGLGDGGGGGGHIHVGVAVPMYQPPPAQQQNNLNNNQPSFCSKVATAFENGVIGGVQLGATLGTAEIVREVVVDTAHMVMSTAYNSMSSKRK